MHYPIKGTLFILLVQFSLPLYASETFFEKPYVRELAHVYEITDLPSGYVEGENPCASVFYIKSNPKDEIYPIKIKVRELHVLAQRLIQFATEAKEFSVHDIVVLHPESWVYEKSTLPFLVELYVIAEKLKAAEVSFVQSKSTLQRARYTITEMLVSAAEHNENAINPTQSKYWTAIRARLFADLMLLRAQSGYYETLTLKPDLDNLRDLFHRLPQSTFPELSGLLTDTILNVREIIRKRNEDFSQNPTRNRSVFGGLF